MKEVQPSALRNYARAKLRMVVARFSLAAAMILSGTAWGQTDSLPNQIPPENVGKLTFQLGVRKILSTAWESTSTWKLHKSPR